MRSTPPTRTSRARPRACSHIGYYTAMEAIAQGLEQVDGEISGDHAAFNDALANLELDAPLGTIKLDENHQAIMDNFLQQIVEDANRRRSAGREDDQDDPGGRSRRSLDSSARRRRRLTGRIRSARRALPPPWTKQGWGRLNHDLRRAVSVAAPATESAEPVLRLRGVGRRFGGVLCRPEGWTWMSSG